MLIFLATFFCLFALYMVYQSVRPLVESAVVTSDDWQRIDDQSMALLGRRDRLLEELRDLEFEASLNKITDQDMDQLRQRYESEALAVMARLETEASDFGTRIDGDIEAVVENARQRHAAKTAPQSTGLADDVAQQSQGGQGAEDGPDDSEGASSEGTEIETRQSDGASIAEDAREPESSADLVPSADQKVCGSCGATNRATARFCDECGHALEAQA